MRVRVEKLHFPRSVTLNGNDVFYLPAPPRASRSCVSHYRAVSTRVYFIKI